MQKNHPKSNVRVRMSTPRPSQPQHSPELSPTAERRAKLISKAREFASLDTSVEVFLQSLLKECVHSLAALSAIVWVEQDRKLTPMEIVHPKAILSNLIQRNDHAVLLKSASLRKGTVVASMETFESTADAAPTVSSWTCLACGIVVPQSRRYVIELIQRHNDTDVDLQNKARLLNDVCGIIHNRLVSSECLALREAVLSFQQCDDFSNRIHKSLDLQQTAATIANDLRHLLSASRVSLGVREGNHIRICGVSGVENPEHHANLLREMSQLAESVVNLEEPLWYEEESDESEWPPQLEKRLRSYLDVSPSRTLIVMPLQCGDIGIAHGGDVELRGVAVIDFFDQMAINPLVRKKVSALTTHATTALVNAQEHSDIFLLPLWNKLKHLKQHPWMFLNSTKTFLCLLFLSLVAAIGMMPAKLKIPAKGIISPLMQNDLFVGCEGIVTNVYVEHGDFVEKGELLAIIQNLDLEFKLMELAGSRDRVMKEVQALRHVIVQAGVNQTEVDSLASKLAQQQERLLSIESQLLLLERRHERCQIRSPIDGHVMTWKPKEELTGRPVTVGDMLLSVASLDTGWELKLTLEEHHAGHVSKAWKSSSEPLEIEFVAVTMPEEKRMGVLCDVESRTQRTPQGTNAISVKAIPSGSFAAEISGSSVTANIDCGRCKLAYSLLHDAIDFFHSRILFWC